jgi:hypothetical protein
MDLRPPWTGLMLHLASFSSLQLLETFSVRRLLSSNFYQATSIKQLLSSNFCAAILNALSVNPMGCSHLNRCVAIKGDCRSLSGRVAPRFNRISRTTAALMNRHVIAQLIPHFITNPLRALV